MAPPAFARPASITVLASVLTGIPAGLLWAVLTVRFTGSSGDAGAVSDVLFGTVALVCGVVVAALVCSRWTPVGLWLIAAVLVGAGLGTAMQWCVGQLVGTVPVRALPVLLAWPIGALVVVVGALLAGADEHTDQAAELTD